MVFQPGQSGNPKGRKPGSRNRGLVLRRYLDKKTKNGRKIANFFLKVMDGKIAGAKVADRVKCAEWLAKWDFGSAPDVIVDEGPDLRSVESQLPEELAELLKFPTKSVSSVVPAEPEPRAQTLATPDESDPPTEGGG